MRFTDQIGHEVTLTGAPERIVSLVPSQSELLFDLGLNANLVGVTKFCIHPKTLREDKTIVGGTKALHLERIAALKPDLIIANKEENRKEDIEELQKHYPVWTSDIKTLDDALAMVDSIGQLCAANDEAQAIIAEITNAFQTIKPIKKSVRTLYLIWKGPYMAAGHDTFIHAMLDRAGFENVLTIEAGRYPELNRAEILALNPDVLMLSSEPFPFKGKHTAEVQADFPNMKVMEVDGELFSWYGSRLKHAPAYFNNLMRAAEKA